MILTRYILKEHLIPFLFGGAIFTFIFITDKIFLAAELIVVKKIGLLDAGRLLLYYLPPVVSLTTGMSALMASLIAWGRLSAEYEIVAIKSAGVSLTRPITVILIIGLVLSGATLIFNELITPSAVKGATRLYTSLLEKHPANLFEEKTFVNIDDRNIYVDKVDSSGRELEGVYIYTRSCEESRSAQSLPRVYYADSAKIIPAGGSLIIILIDGVIHQIDEDEPSRYHLLTFRTHTLRLLLPEEKKSTVVPIEGMSILELWALIKQYEGAELGIRPLLVELARKTAIPFAPLACILIGIPFGLMTKPNRPMVGFGWSLLIIFGYYLILIMGEALGTKGIMQPMIAMWLPNIIMVTSGVILFRRLT